MPLPSTKLSFFLLVERLEGLEKIAMSQKGFKAILLLKERIFYSSSDVTNNSPSREMKRRNPKSQETFQTRHQLKLILWKRGNTTLKSILCCSLPNPVGWFANIEKVLQIYCLDDAKMHPGKRRALLLIVHGVSTLEPT